MACPERILRNGFRGRMTKVSVLCGILRCAILSDYASHFVFPSSLGSIIEIKWTDLVYSIKLSLIERNQYVNNEDKKTETQKGLIL